MYRHSEKFFAFMSEVRCQQPDKFNKKYFRDVSEASN